MRPRATIFVKLLAAFALPTVLLFGLFGYVAYDVARGDLDAELGTRLAAVAASAATHVRGKYLVDLAAGDESDRGYQNVLQKLQAVSAATGARLFVFDRQYQSRVDTDNGVAIRTPYYQAELDRHELVRVFDRGVSTASVTFDGRDGKTYKTGYAAVRASETEPDIVLAIGAQAPATYFHRLADLRRQLMMWGGALVTVVLGATLLAAFLITRNVRRLRDAAERIGRGELTSPVAIRSSDELGVLAATMERMRDQLAERDARMQQMLAGIAHEVRNPLAGMTLYAGILRDELPAGDERLGHVGKIDRELGYLERVVNEFLNYARRPQLEKSRFDIRALLAEIAPMAAVEGVPVVVADGEPVWIFADAAQLRRALLNLAQNAVQAAGVDAATVVELQPRVRLDVDARGDRIAITVWNRGAALPAEIVAKIFDPFFTTREKGTGLGLAFAREIAVEHGGSLAVVSADGETTFTLTVPGLAV